MRVSSDVSIQKRYRQPLSEELKGYFRDPGFDPEIYRVRFEKTQIYGRNTGFNCSEGGGMGFAKILARDAILGSSGCGIVVKKGSGNVGLGSPFQTLLSMSLLEPTQLVI